MPERRAKRRRVRAETPPIETPSRTERSIETPSPEAASPEAASPEAASPEEFPPGASYPNSPPTRVAPYDEIPTGVSVMEVMMQEARRPFPNMDPNMICLRAAFNYQARELRRAKRDIKELVTEMQAKDTTDAGTQTEDVDGVKVSHYSDASTQTQMQIVYLWP